MAIVVLTFILILGIVLGAYYAFVVRPERGERSTLLARLAKPKGTSQLLKAGALERPVEKLSDVRAVQAVLLRANGLSRPIERLITQSGLQITVGTLVMASVLLGCLGYLVVKLPSWPVFIAWSMSRASSLRTSPMTMRSGRIRRALTTRSRWRTAPLPSMLAGRVSRRTT